MASGPAGDIRGIVFSCARQTYEECMAKRLFGSPANRWRYVQAIHPGMTLFLLNTSERSLYGVFRAVGRGAMNIDPNGWTGGRGPTRFPAQVRFEYAEACEPLHESVFSRVLPREGGTGGGHVHYRYTLDQASVDALCALFRRRRIAVPLGGYGVQQNARGNQRLANVTPMAMEGYPHSGVSAVAPTAKTPRVEAESGWGVAPSQGWGTPVPAPAAVSVATRDNYSASAAPRDNYGSRNYGSDAAVPAYGTSDGGGSSWGGPQLVSISDGASSGTTAPAGYRDTADSGNHIATSRGDDEAMGGCSHGSATTARAPYSSGMEQNVSTRAGPQAGGWGGYQPVPPVPYGSSPSIAGLQVLTSSDLERFEADFSQRMNQQFAEQGARWKAEYMSDMQRLRGELESGMEGGLQRLAAGIRQEVMGEIAGLQNEIRELGARMSVVEIQIVHAGIA
eukprot:jgi/Mesvir1/6223/Mv00903-RA.1